jgi:hypothetical protein
MNILQQTIGNLQASNTTLTTRIATLEVENTTLTAANRTLTAQVTKLLGGAPASALPEVVQEPSPQSPLWQLLRWSIANVWLILQQKWGR